MSRPVGNLQGTVAGVAVVLLVGGALWFGFGPDQQPPLAPVPFVDETASMTVIVHVSGAVVHPGVVAVRAEGRVADALAAAGGAAGDADLAKVNLAATIRDGDLIVVPRMLATGATADGDSSTGIESAGIDINSSPASQLEDLPGVGPVLAKRIVAYREDHGPFSVIEDLLDVPGIGEAKLAGIRDGIVPP